MKSSKGQKVNRIEVKLNANMKRHSKTNSIPIICSPNKIFFSNGHFPKFIKDQVG